MESHSVWNSQLAVWMSILKMHTPTHASVKFAGKSHLADAGLAIFELTQEKGPVAGAKKSSDLI
jgi:hypothetical protein